MVTPERQEQVLFVHPYYYTSGTALAALEEQLGSLPEGWDSLRGKNVCTVVSCGYPACSASTHMCLPSAHLHQLHRQVAPALNLTTQYPLPHPVQEGHYLNDFVAETYGAKLVLTATEAAAVDALVRGECIAGKLRFPLHGLTRPGWALPAAGAKWASFPTAWSSRMLRPPKKHLTPCSLHRLRVARVSPGGSGAVRQTGGLCAQRRGFRCAALRPGNGPKRLCAGHQVGAAV